MEKNIKSENVNSINFMLNEYERLHEQRINATAQLERRVNFFLTIASASIGGIFLLSQNKDISASTIL